MKVAFIGHRKIERTQELEERLSREIEKLIVNDGADVFLFGSRSEFDSLCYEIITELKIKYPYISRVYVRGEFEYINKSYTDYLLESYEDTFFPEQAKGAGALSYIKRNQAMVDMCDVLVAYYKESYSPATGTQSGTQIAVAYARKLNKKVVNVI